MDYAPQSVVALSGLPCWHSWPAPTELQGLVLNFWQQRVWHQAAEIRTLPGTCQRK